MKNTPVLVLDEAGTVAPLQRAELSDGVGAAARAHPEEFLAELWEYLPRGVESSSDPSLLFRLKRYIKRGDLANARALMRELLLDSAEEYNLSGVVHEMEGNLDEAWRFYSLALALDRTLGAADLNRQRMLELYTFGHSGIPVCL